MESKRAAEQNGNSTNGNIPEPMPADADGFMYVPDELGDELPFN